MFTLPLARSSVAGFTADHWPYSDVKSLIIKSDATRYLKRIARIQEQFNYNRGRDLTLY